MTTTIDPNRVNEIFLSCLYTDEELAASPTPTPDGVVKAQGLRAIYGFHPERIAAAADEVAAMLRLLPDEFLAGELGGGGGWSFLQACTDRNGELWTGMHERVEQLMALGIGAGYVEIPLPPEVWPVLPGAVPYFTVVNLPLDHQEV